MLKSVLKVCSRHGLTPQTKKKDGYYRCRKCSVEHVATRRKKVKQQIIEEFGGKCKVCGYNKSHYALEFHHLDPDQKEAEVVQLACLGIDRMREEAKKCVLLCSNCHREVHGGVTAL